jgi:hypothetical protein
MKVRIVAPGWENFTGPLGQGAYFENGEADLNWRQVARIGASIHLVDAETGEQVGPAAIAAAAKYESAPVIPELANKSDLDAAAEADAAAEREKLAKAEEERKAKEAEALEAAKEKAAAEAKEVVWSRQELEAVGANDGVEGLRKLADPLGVKGRSITELVDKILEAQAKNAAK